MSRLPTYLHRERTRHGKLVWYVRCRKGQRVRLRAAYGTAEFIAEYEAALRLAREPRPTPDKTIPGTLGWLIARYRETAEWRALSPATRRQREYFFQQAIASAGKVRIRDITSAAIVAGRDRRKNTPALARNFLNAMRGLFSWAYDEQHIASDPTAGVKYPRKKQGPGFKKWTEDEIAAYERRWPIGTRQRVWLDVLTYTGLRRGDAVRLGTQHVRNGVAVLTAEKTGTVLTLPILPVLQRTLDAGPCGEHAYIVGANGKPLTKESFGNLFKEACRDAGVDEHGKAAHGLRKLGATRAAEAGATVAELEAIFGWHGGGMASLYTREADRVRLAKGAIDKLLRKAGEQTTKRIDQGGKLNDGVRGTREEENQAIPFFRPSKP